MRESSNLLLHDSFWKTLIPLTMVTLATSTTPHTLNTSTTPESSNTSTAANNNTIYTSTYREAFISLQDNLEARRSVVKRLPPMYSNETPMAVWLQPYQIIAVDDDLQLVNFKMQFGVNWTDHELKWNPGDYEGIGYTRVSTWTPFMFIAEDIDGHTLSLPDSKWLTADGEVGWMDNFSVKYLCFLDMQLFPFDEHKCNFTIIFQRGVRPYFQKEKFEISFNTTAEWRICCFSCMVRDKDELGSFHGVCTMHISRRVNFYITNILIPMTIMSLVSLAVFTIPPQTGQTYASYRSPRPSFLSRIFPPAPLCLSPSLSVLYLTNSYCP